MSARDAAAMLMQAMKDLNLEWEETKIKWLDSKAAEFEQEYLAKLPHELSKACEAMKEIDKLLNKVRSDCESSS